MEYETVTLTISELIQALKENGSDKSEFLEELEILPNVKIKSYMVDFTDKEGLSTYIQVYMDINEFNILMMTNKYKNKTIPDDSYPDGKRYEVIKDDVLFVTDKVDEFYSYTIFIDDVDVNKIKILYNSLIHNERIFINEDLLNAILTSVIDYGIYLNKI